MRAHPNIAPVKRLRFDLGVGPRRCVRAGTKVPDYKPHELTVWRLEASILRRSNIRHKLAAFEVVDGEALLSPVGLLAGFKIFEPF